MSAPSLRVSISPDARPEYARAVELGGATVVPIGADPDVLVWSRHGDPQVLASEVVGSPSLKWVQLPAAGVEDFFRAGAIAARPDLIWTSAKGAYAEPVAEHALMLMLALLRRLPERVRATTWGPQFGRSLYGKRVLIVGGGGIARELARLLAAFRARTVIIRRRPAPVENASEVVGMDELHRRLPEADIVVLAAAFTPETAGLMSESEFALMRADAILVNVARGGLVVTEHLVDALESATIDGAALDVTDPEPLPDGHPLWGQPRAIITPHSADTIEMIVPLLAVRLRENVNRYLHGRELLGLVDPVEGY